MVFDTPDGFDVPVDNDLHPGMAIMSMDGSRRLYWIQFNRSKNVVALMKLDDEKGTGRNNFGRPPFQATAQLSVENPQPDLLRLDGELDGQHIHVSLHRTQINFILRSRGFHWINNRPFWGR